MYYIIIVILTFFQSLLMNWMMGLPVFDASPYTLRLWCNYIAAAMILWSPMLLTNKRRWTYAFAILLNVWFVGNLIYFRSYGDVLNRWCLQNASNMDGIWNSIIPFLRWGDLFFPCITILWIIISETIRINFFFSLWKRICLAFIAFLLFCAPQTLIHKKAELPISPFNSYYADLSMGRIWYVHTFGAITHFANEVINLVVHREEKVTPVREKEITDYIQVPDSIPEQGNLMLIIVESLEDWTIGLDVNGQEVTPNINRLVDDPKTGHYPMIAQVKEGKSSDARLIAFNGLLPICNGAASMRYAANTYPSLVKYSYSCTKQMYASSRGHSWNFEMNSNSYGFDSLYADIASDGIMANIVNHTIAKSPTPFIISICTMASHSPFLEFADSSSLDITNSNYDETKTRYLRCVHYTDSAIGCVINTILTDATLANNTRIVITGDHPIFDLITPVPFIIYDPFMSPVAVSRPLYQIDIYTTLVERMHIATPWRGLGKNIADSCAYTKEEMKALETLSDRLIRTNYFSDGFVVCAH